MEETLEKSGGRSNGGWEIVVSGMRLRTRDQTTSRLSKGPLGEDLFDRDMARA
jgi:hypothetical protein